MLRHDAFEISLAGEGEQLFPVCLNVIAEQHALAFLGSEIEKSPEDAQKHPEMWLLKRTTELAVFRHRWSDLPRQEGRAEMFFNMVADHLEGACNALYLLRQERENKAYGQASPLRYVNNKGEQ